MEALVAGNLERLAVRANADDVRSASEWLETVCSDSGVPTEQLSRLDLCLNEALANIIFHGGPTAQLAPVLLALKIKSDEESVQAELFISDTGCAFNPLAADAAPHAQSLAEAVPGGLGLSMIRGYSDHMDYANRDGRNHLTLMFRWFRRQ